MHTADEAARRVGTIAYMTKPGEIELREHELPAELEPGSLLLEVLQSNVCGSDIHVFAGRHPLLKCGGLGHEMVGRVIAMAADVRADRAGTALKIGDRVVPVYTAVCNACENCNRGVPNHCDNAFRHFGRSHLRPHFGGATFATHYIVHPDQYFYRVPDSVADAAAASANCALSQVLFGLERSQVGLGQTVVIQGAGGLGLCAAAVARERGARVIVFDKVPARLQLARVFGAEHVVDVSEVPELQDRVELVKRLSNAQGADVVVEVTGVLSVFSEGISYLRPEGTYAVMGTISPGQTAAFDPGLLVRKSARVLGINRYPPGYLHQAMAFLERCKDKYPFEKMLDRTFSLDQTQLAIEMSARREVQRATIVMNTQGAAR